MSRPAVALLLIAVIGTGGWSGGVPLLAQEGTAPTAPDSGFSSGPSALGIRQQRVEQLVEELSRKFTSLAISLQEKEPERAERLKQTLEASKKMLLQERTGDITKLLDAANLGTATASQQELLGDIRKLISLLLDDPTDRDKIREEFERLSEWKKQIESIIESERGEKREADRVANKEQTLAALAARIAAVEALLEKQKGILEATESVRAEGIQKLGPIVGQQASVRQDAQAVLQDIAAEAGDPLPGEGAVDGGAKPGEGKPGEGKPGEGKPGEGKPGEGKPGEGKPGEGKPGEGKPGEGKPGEGKPGEGKPGEGKPGEGKPGEGGGEQAGGEQGGESGEGGAGGQPAGAPKRPKEAGERPLEEAIKNQKSAEKNLQDGKGKAAQQEEQSAVDNLERALAELKREESRIATLPPEAFDKMAGKQDDIANQTAKVGEQMDKAGKPAGEQGGEQGGGQPGGGESGGGQSGGGQSGGGEQAGGKPQPGQQKVQEAQQQMQQASGDLRKQQPEDASRKQGKAIKTLEEALQEIEDRLAQLREETQIEKLAKLEQRFREILARQEQASADTVGFEAKRLMQGGELKRTDRLALGKVSAEERGLAELSQQTLDIILDDGTSVVFPDVVAQLRDDLLGVAQLIEAKRTDAYTQSLQKEIELTLAELIEALQEAQQQKESDGDGGGGGGGGGGEEPLLPGSAELKLLRSAQLRVNRRTVSLDTARDSEGKLAEDLRDQVRQISDRQAEIGDMTIRILERSAEE